MAPTQRHRHSPGRKVETTFHGRSRIVHILASVVPLEPLGEVCCQTNVVPRGVTSACSADDTDSVGTRMEIALGFTEVSRHAAACPRQ